MPFNRTAVPFPAGNAAVSVLWHSRQATVRCNPVKANAARSCEKAAGANFGAAIV